MGSLERRRRSIRGTYNELFSTEGGKKGGGLGRGVRSPTTKAKSRFRKGWGAEEKEKKKFHSSKGIEKKKKEEENERTLKRKQAGKVPKITFVTPQFKRIGKRVRQAEPALFLEANAPFSRDCTATG